MGQVVPVQGCNSVNKSDGKWLSETQFELISSSFQKIKWEFDITEIIAKTNL